MYPRNNSLDVSMHTFFLDDDNDQNNNYQNNNQRPYHLDITLSRQVSEIYDLGQEK